MSARILGVVNQKGGVGKTTTAHNVACQAKREGYSVLLVDCDQQGTLSMLWGLTPTELIQLDTDRKTLLHALLEPMAEQVPLLDVVVSAPDRPDLIPSSFRLGRLPQLLRYTPDLALKKALRRPSGAAASDKYDLIVLDCPASIGLMNACILLAATDVLIPCLTQQLAFVSMQESLHEVHEVQMDSNNELQVLGFLPTMVQAQTHDRQVTEALQSLAQRYNVPCFSPIPNAAAYKQAGAKSMSVMEFAPKTRGAEAYAAIVGTLMRGEAA